VDIYLLDGTYELFRHFYAVPSHVNDKGEEVAATRGVLASVIGMLESGVTHIGVATDHVIESFRNDMWPGYKTGEGVDPRLLAQFIPLEEALETMGIATWPMVELEADDAIAAAAVSLAKLSAVNRVIICSPDKDFAQCIKGDKIVQLNRRTEEIRNETGVHARFGVGPSSIPDYLALVGDTADGYPGLDGWGEKASSTVLGAYSHLEKIPSRAEDWKVQVRRADVLASTLRKNFKLALLFRDLATLRTRKPKLTSTSKVHWKGPRQSFAAFCKRLDATELEQRVAALTSKKG
jgi:5'-3' exonuclease